MLCIDFLAKTIEKIQAKNFTRLINPHYLTPLLEIYISEKKKAEQSISESPAVFILLVG